MKTSLSFKVAALAAILSGAPCCFPQSQYAEEAQSAKHFVENLYAGYGPNGDPVSLSGANADQVFDPSLIKLAKTLEAIGSGYVGALGYDHLCNCKDTDVTFPNLRIMADPVTKDRANATVTFTGDDGSKNTILITLALGADHWRIDDIKDFTGPPPYTSLRELLQSEIKAMKKQTSH
ncbi:MAG: hypothetical protein WA634_09550 [Silvibacterium sp.]